MKRFFILGAAHYCGVVLLLFFLVWFVPDQFAGDPPLRGTSLFLSRIGIPTAAIAMVLAFPSLHLAGFLQTTVVPYQAILLTMPISSALWSCIIIFLHRLWLRRRIVHSER
jgi:hypothetical protein